MLETGRRSAIALAVGLLAAGSAGQGSPTWVLQAGSAPGARFRPGLAYDAARQKTVLFGGSFYLRRGLLPTDGTFEWDGRAWTRRRPTAEPPSIDGPLIYDRSRSRAVMLSADPASQPAAETWEWDGDVWMKAPALGAPPWRTQHGMAYDEARQRVVLFGGEAGRRTFSDTWTWDGTSWTQHMAATAPRARTDHAMAYDTVRGVVVLFGGMDDAGQQLADTWEWDGARWTERSPPTTPAPRSGHQMVNDRHRERIVLTGGRMGASPGSDRWEWDGATWTQTSTGVPVGPTGQVALTYDEVRRRLVLLTRVGGIGSPPFDYEAETWEHDGKKWCRQISKGTVAVDVSGRAMAYDEARGRMVLAGGYRYVFSSGATWEWDGTDWQGPFEGADQVPVPMAFDHVRQQVLRFGQPDWPSPPPDPRTKVWDGRRWSTLPVRTPTLGVDMASDRRRKQIVMYAHPQQTWLWDGTNWSLAPTHTGPAPGGRRAFAKGAFMCYDERRDRVVLVNGPDLLQPTRPPETWEWDGSQWSQRFPATPAGPALALAYDARRERTVMIEAAGASGLTPGRTWEWDGTDWTRGPPGPSSSTAFFAMDYDRKLQTLIAFDGDRTFAYAEDRASVSGYGTGCGASVPALRVLGSPWLGNRQLGLRVSGLTAGDPVTFLLSMSQASQPLAGGCTLLVDPFAQLPPRLATTDELGLAVTTLRVPTTPGVAGLAVYAQAAVLDAAGPALGFNLSAGYRLIAGH
ncbi:MAG: hypothetical protein AAF628_29945 [Planctomycetota bacterium]